MRRRDLFVIGGAVAVAISIPPMLRRWPSEFEFQPLAGEDGFRRLNGGEISGGIDPFFGLQSESESAKPHTKPLCKSLFGDASWPEGKVPVAFFTDANCPYCKTLERRLVETRDEGTLVELMWHELPLLGPSSVRHARAQLAARKLGSAQAAREYLSSRLLRPGPVALGAMAEEIGLDPDEFIEIAQGTEVDAMLVESLALGRRLGVPGTPATVIGRTLVIGAIKDADVQKLIDLELSQPRNVCR